MMVFRLTKHVILARAYREVPLLARESGTLIPEKCHFSTQEVPFLCEVRPLRKRFSEKTPTTYLNMAETPMQTAFRHR